MSSELRGARVAVTGSAGVIGRELLRLLQEVGAEVLSWDREPLPAGESLRAVTHVQSDLAVADLRQLEEFRPRVLFHLAAAFERSVETPEFWSTNWRDNTLVSHRLAHSLREMLQTEVCIFASSYLIYAPELYMFPHPPQAPSLLEESAAVAPRNLCGAAKLYAERELEFVRELVRPTLRTVYARIYRVYGRGSRDIISRWVRAALRGQELRVYNRENQFDYIFAGDVAQGLVRLATTAQAQGVRNLGSGRAHRVEDVLCAVIRHVPEARQLIADAGSAAPFEASCADTTALHELLGWRPGLPLEQGIGLIVEYERGRLEEERAHGRGENGHC